MVASQLTDSSVAADRRLINAIPSVAIGFGVAFVCMFEYGLPKRMPVLACYPMSMCDADADASYFLIGRGFGGSAYLFVSTSIPV